MLTTWLLRWRRRRIAAVEYRYYRLTGLVIVNPMKIHRHSPGSSCMDQCTTAGLPKIVRGT